MGPKTVLLHIGTPKTGTTTIQQSLVRAQEQGALAPYCYPMPFGARNHNRMVWLYLSREELAPVLAGDSQRNPRRFRRVREQYRRRLFDELGSSQGAVLSGEAMSGDLSVSHAAQLRSDLESLGFRKFHVLLYVRDPAEMYLSITQELLKWSSAEVLVEDPASFTYDFRRAAESWEEAFPGQVIVRRFPGSSGDILDDFSGQMEECFGIGLPRSPMRTNTTISAEAMQILHDYRSTLGPDDGGYPVPGLDRIAEFLGHSTGHVAQTRPVLKRAVAEQIRVNHQADAEFLNSRYGVDLGLGNPSPPPLPLHRQSYRVEDIVESVDSEVVHRLLLEFARRGHEQRSARRWPPVWAAARAYRSLPLSLRPARLDAWLRSRLGRRLQP